MVTERRRHPRKKVSPSTTVFCFSTEFNVPASNRNNLAVKLVDVGGKGACVVTVGRLRESLPVQIEIAIPEAHERFRARGVVRWSQTWTHNSREANVSGIEFMEILEASGEQVQFLTQGCRRPRAAPVGVDLKREHRNALLKETRVVIRTRGFWSAIGFSTETQGRLTDLTESGFQMVTPSRFETGQRLDARLDFTSPRSHVSSEIVIQSCRRDTLVLEPKFEVEAIFANIPAESQANLDGILALLRSYSSEGPRAP
jgi:hypothetical protein